jgi:hypothetical protein
LFNLSLLLVQGCRVSTRRCRQSQVALEYRQARLVALDLLAQCVALQRVHSDCLTQRLAIRLPARRA